jgi:uncharacterized membrane protein YcaP (DUF421 family)
MVNTLYTLLGEGLEAGQLTVLQVCLRGVIVFLSALVIVRIASKRFFAKKTAFDLILGFILGSMLARAINGSEKLGPTIAAGFLLAILHRLLDWIAFHSHGFGNLIKGKTAVLIRDGVPDRVTMKRHLVSEADLYEDLRLQGVERPTDVSLATFERSGDVSVIKKEK